MTDKEIALMLADSRWWPTTFKGFALWPETSYREAKRSVHVINAIINSINWED